MIVHVIWHLDIGGGEVFLLGLTRALARRGVDQHVLTVGPAGPLAAEVEAAGVPVTPFHKSSKAGLVTIGRIARLLKQLAPTVVHAHGEAGLFWGVPAARLAAAPVVSLIYQNADETRAKMRASRAMLRLVDIVVAGSSDVERFVGDAFTVPKERLRMIYCGIETAAFAGAGRGRLDNHGSPALVTVGRLVERKGHRALLEAFALVRQRVPGARLIIVGDGPERGALEQFAVDRAVRDAVTFMGTVYPTIDVLANADLFVFPSLAEPQGLALVEAYAAGVPVVASRTGGIAEMLEDGVDGLLAEPGDVPGLSAAILRMIDDPALAQSCAARARRRLAMFDVTTIADTYIELYRSVAARHASLSPGRTRPSAPDRP